MIVVTDWAVVGDIYMKFVLITTIHKLTVAADKRKLLLALPCNQLCRMM